MALRYALALAAMLSMVLAGVPAGHCEGTSSPVANDDTVTITVLKGDTYKSLSRDLTGSSYNAELFRDLAPTLTPGMKLPVPRKLLRSYLKGKSTVTFRLCDPYKTVWALVRGEMDPSSPLEENAMAHNIQRLSGISDGARMRRGQRLTVPVMMLAREAPQGIEERGGDAVAKKRPAPLIFGDYRVKELKGLKRSSPANDMPEYFKEKLKERGVWDMQTITQRHDLVVIHSTEHGGVNFDNVASFMSKNQLTNYLIGPGGEIYEIVPEEYRAFGCGESLWHGTYEVDHEAINIELFADTLKGPNYSPINDKQYKALATLLGDIYSRYPEIDSDRVVTHRMVALNYRYEMRSRKGDPYEFDWAKAGLPDNSIPLDQDMVMGRAILVDNKRYYDRVTEGQYEAARLISSL
ncbi:MAG: hypothetical protein C0608_01165 [Deltaproteobacteria bacterium]|mgnify:CR=1 FL=1|nr:MAG: hypothetical protein C0608_01165 [Deltaproteobacteria bacterium]